MPPTCSPLPTDNPSSGSKMAVSRGGDVYRGRMEKYATLCMGQLHQQHVDNLGLVLSAPEFGKDTDYSMVLDCEDSFDWNISEAGDISVDFEWDERCLEAVDDVIMPEIDNECLEHSFSDVSGCTLSDSSLDYGGEREGEVKVLDDVDMTVSAIDSFSAADRVVKSGIERGDVNAELPSLATLQQDLALEGHFPFDMAPIATTGDGNRALDELDEDDDARTLLLALALLQPENVTPPTECPIPHDASVSCPSPSTHASIPTAGLNVSRQECALPWHAVANHSQPTSPELVIPRPLTTMPLIDPTDLYAVIALNRQRLSFAPPPTAIPASRDNAVPPSAVSLQKCLISPLAGVKDCTMLTRALSSSISRASASGGLEAGDSAADEAVDVLVGGGMDEAAVSEVIREVSQLVSPRHGSIDQTATVELRDRHPLTLTVENAGRLHQSDVQNRTIRQAGVQCRASACSMICKCSDLPCSLNLQAADSCAQSLGSESTAAACVTWNIAIKTTVASPLGDEEQVSGCHLNLVHNVDRNAAKKRKAREHYQDDAISSQAAAWGVPTVDASTERGKCDALRLHCQQVGKGQQRAAGGGDGVGNGPTPTCLRRMSFDVAVIKRKRSGVHLIFNPGQGLGAPSDVLFKMLSEQTGVLNGLLTQDGSRLVASRKGLGGGECHSATHHGTCAAIHLACRDLDQKLDFTSFVRHGAIRVGRMSSGEAMTGELSAGAAKACRQYAFAVYNQCKVAVEVSRLVAASVSKVDEIIQRKHLQQEQVVGARGGLSTVYVCADISQSRHRAAFNTVDDDATQYFHIDFRQFANADTNAVALEKLDCGAEGVETVLYSVPQECVSRDIHGNKPAKGLQT